MQALLENKIPLKVIKLLEEKPQDSIESSLRSVLQQFKTDNPIVNGFLEDVVRNTAGKLRENTNASIATIAESTKLALETFKAGADVSKTYEEGLKMIVVAAMDAGKGQYFLSQRLMDQIIRGMKEIPELPSEIPPANDTNALKEVIFPEKGGVLTYMADYTLPYKGFPYWEFVEKIDSIKKIARATFSGLYHRLKTRNPLLFLTLIPSAWIFKDALYSQLLVYHRVIDRFKLKVIRHCDAIRELHRAFSIPLPKESELQKDIREKVRDLTCMILEYDNAYRFRVQDIVPELNKESLKKHPRKELLRLLGIMVSREKTQEIKDTWKLVRYFVSLYLVFDRKLVQMIVHVLSNLDLNEVSLSEEDKQFALKRKDYIFGFQLNVV